MTCLHLDGIRTLTDVGGEQMMLRMAYFDWDDAIYRTADYIFVYVDGPSTSVMPSSGSARLPEIALPLNNGISTFQFCRINHRAAGEGPAASKTVKSSVVQGSLTSGAKDATLISSQCGTTLSRCSSGSAASWFRIAVVSCT